jgi:hypothetical protein
MLCSIMPKQNISVVMDELVIAMVDQLAGDAARSRSWMIQQLVEKAMKEVPSGRLERAVVEPKSAPKTTKSVDEVLGPRVNAPIDGLKIPPAPEETPKCGKCKKSNQVVNTGFGWRCQKCGIGVTV